MVSIILVKVFILAIIVEVVWLVLILMYKVKNQKSFGWWVITFLSSMAIGIASVIFKACGM